MNWLVTAATGGLAGALLTLATQWISARLQIWRLSRRLDANTEKLPGCYRVRVCNGGIRTVEATVAYIHLDHDLDDLMDGSAFIGPHNRFHMGEDRLCWSVAGSDPNPYRMDIYPGEMQALDLLQFHDDRIEIASEQGRAGLGANEKRQSRMYLRNKRYAGRLHVVARNSLRRSFDLVIDNSNGKQDVNISIVKAPRWEFWRFFFCATTPIR